MAGRGKAPQLFRRVHRSARTPVTATAVVSLLIWIAALWLGLVVLAQLTSLVLLAVFALVNLAALRIKRRHRPPPGTPSYPIAIPLIGFSLCILLIGLQLYLGFG